LRICVGDRQCPECDQGDGVSSAGTFHEVSSPASSRSYPKAPTLPGARGPRYAISAEVTAGIATRPGAPSQIKPGPEAA
jgi:hypothetical protein